MDIWRQKYGKLIGFFNLIFGDMDEEEKGLLEEKLIECYKMKGITFDDESLYKEKIINGKKEKVFKESIDMPILENLYQILRRHRKN